MQLRGTLILFSVLSLNLAESQNTSCGNDLKTLEKALLQTGNNTLKLLQAFYPPRQSPATFVTVYYNFLDADGNITCNTTWFWTSVEFYLIQPPTIFLYTSLFFTIPQDRITTANITFQADCRELVTWNKNGTCTCTSNGMLDILTQRLKFYTMFNNPDDINIDDNLLGTAVCEDEQEIEYDDCTAVLPFSITGILIPFCVIFLLVMIIWSSRAKISAAMNKEQNHANFAALALTGLVFSTFTVVLDIVALVLVVQRKHEFPTSYSNLNSLIFVIITTVFDAVAVLVEYTALAALIVLLCFRCSVCLKSLLYFRCSVCLRSLLHFRCPVWLVILMCFAPLFCLASHSGYIIVAWVSDTQHAESATFFYIISFFYYFIIFRQSYIIFGQLCKFCKRKARRKQLCKCCNRKAIHCQVTSFNIAIFFIEILLGLFLVGAEVHVIRSLIVLPVTVITAPKVGSLASFPSRTRYGNEANVIQLAFIIITGLFTYKFIYTEDEPKEFMKAFVKYVKEQNLEGLDLNELQDAKAAGKVVGKMVYTIINEPKQFKKGFVKYVNTQNAKSKHA